MKPIYKIVWAFTIPGLENKVRQALKDGYELRGGVAIGLFFVQALELSPFMKIQEELAAIRLNSMQQHEQG